MKLTLAFSRISSGGNNRNKFGNKVLFPNCGEAAKYETESMLVNVMSSATGSAAIEQAGPRGVKSVRTGTN